MASTPATVADFRGLSDAEVHNYATVALTALRERAATNEINALPSIGIAQEMLQRAGEHLEDLNGHCDTCGALCDQRGCAADRGHVVALAG